MLSVYVKRAFKLCRSLTFNISDIYQNQHCLYSNIGNDDFIPHHVIDYWFGSISNKNDKIADSFINKWYSGTTEIDSEISSLFSHHMENALEYRKYDHWKQNAFGSLALILMGDQFSRSIYRNTPKMFAYDSYALDICNTGINMKFDEELLELHPMFVHFFYSPLLHSEQMSMHTLMSEKYEWLMNQSTEHAMHSVMLRAMEFNSHHSELIAKFGRFPQRNELLGRQSTEEELAEIKRLGLDSLITGNAKQSRNIELLQKFQITHIVNIVGKCHFEHQFEYYSCHFQDYKLSAENDHIYSQNTNNKQEEKEYMIKQKNNQKQKRQQVQKRNYKNIRKAKQNRIFIHCSAGMSRSPSIVIAYLMHKYHLSLKHSYCYVIERRSCIRPNIAFLKQLRTYESQLITNTNQPNSISSTELKNIFKLYKTKWRNSPKINLQKTGTMK